MGSDVPVVANTGAKSTNLESLLDVADGIIVGSDLKRDGYTWAPVDPQRVEQFMEAAGGRTIGQSLQSLLLGIDIGTTATKCLLLDPLGGVVAGEAERPTYLVSEQAGWAEEDPDEWWSNVCSITRELAADVEVAAVGVAGMVPCTVLLDEH